MKAFFRLLLGVWIMACGAASADTPAELRQKRNALEKDGLWKDSLALYESGLRQVSDEKSGEDLAKAVNSVQRLDESWRLDALVEGAVAAHPGNPHLLLAAAGSYQLRYSYGSIIGGEFKRGSGGGMYVSTEYRDRIRSLQLLLQSLAAGGDEGVRTAAWEAVAQALNRQRQPWSLQALTPLDKLPDWAESSPQGAVRGVPWIDGKPVLYPLPASWEAAENDGQRLRFAWEQIAKAGPRQAVESVLARAAFSAAQFGPGTSIWRRDPDEAKVSALLETLEDDEVAALTTDGLKKFSLPPEHHFIALYQSILDDPATDGRAGEALVRIYLERGRNVKAAEVMRRTIAIHGKGPSDYRQAGLDQLTGNWGSFLPARTVPAGTRPTLALRFRNGARIHLSAAPVDMDAVLAETIDYLKSNPRDLERERISPSDIASRIIRGDAPKYLGEAVRNWDEELQPAAGHLDTWKELSLPLEKAGAWWITGKMEGGNEFHTLVWIVDGLLVEREFAEGFWWLADAGSGAPVEGAQVRFFGYRTVGRGERKSPQERRSDIETKSVERTTDADGRVALKPGELDREFEWMVVARKEGRGTVFSGFRPYGYDPLPFENGNRDVGYGITDRPLYRAGDTVHLKFLLRSVGYFEPDERKFADRTGTLVLRGPRGDEAVTLSDVKTDELGAAEAQVSLPQDAALGEWNATYQISDAISTTILFRVEEYRKPEFQVTVEAPAEPVRAGGKFTFTVRASYFHGAPVREAEVEYTVTRGMLAEPWFPTGRWDWLYGKGAWWPGGDVGWHPGYRSWSCGPAGDGPGFFPQPWMPSEVVLEGKVKIGADGTAKVEVDTAAALEAHGDMDHRYTIGAKVTDASRREESGGGQVIAARKPFEMVVWTDRGYASPGAEVEATVSAAALTGKPVAAAEGILKLLRITVDPAGEVTETEVSSWPLKTDAEGMVRQRFPAPAAGQYRLAAELSLSGGEKSAAGSVLNVFGGERSEPADWKFGAIELVADKLEYAPGDTLKLRVNSDRADAHVWLFLHIAGGEPRAARLIRLDGKSLEVPVPLDRRDMPNMYVEAITVHGAEVHTASRQILLPPESKMIEVALETAGRKVKPRGSSTLLLSLKDHDGHPVAGKVALTIYDKALEAITGGSNVPPIRDYFWGWKNGYYQGQAACDIPASPGNLVRPKEPEMEVWEPFPAGLMAGRAGGRERGSFGALGTGAAVDSVQGNQPDAFAPAAPGAPEFKGLAAREPAPPLLVRKDFADLVKWQGTLVTDGDGRAEIPVTFPDNLTTWKARVWVLGSGTRVGEGSAEIVTSKDLLVRLQAPRFLVERDEAVLGAVVHNDHDAEKTVTVSLELEGDALGTVKGKTETVKIAPHSEARVDWTVKAEKEGVARVRMTAETDGDGDAVERELPVHVHGMPRQDAWSRVVSPEESSATITVEVPEKLRTEETRLTIRYSPSVAMAVVDAIPYLADYPHGCTEQTLNRFLPAAMARRMLQDMNVDLAEVKRARTNLNAQQLGDRKMRAGEWRQWTGNPVFEEGEVDRMVAAGVKRLISMQNADGGWGWFSGYGEQSYPHTTAVVMHGLLAGRPVGVEAGDPILARGLSWLKGYEEKQVAALKRHDERQAILKAGGKAEANGLEEKPEADALDAFVRETLARAGAPGPEMTDFLFRDRVDLPVYGKVLLALALDHAKDAARRDEVMAMLAQFVKRDAENQTAFLQVGNDSWWSWYGSQLEANAWYLQLLASVKPKDADARALAKYLVNNRRGGTWWSSTRDTAYAVEAIAAYAKASGETAPEMEVEVLMDGKSLGKTAINRDNLFSFGGTITLDGKAVAPGRHEIEIRRVTGGGSVYANAYLEVFSLEDRLRPAGLEVKVQRKYWKIARLAQEGKTVGGRGQMVAQKEERVQRTPLEDGAHIASGDTIEVELIIEAKNDYEYVLFSDAKPAGCEAVEALSGYQWNSGGGLIPYMEPRDRSVDFFIRSLPRGTHALRYELRAETPGAFKALPADVSGMYAPELRGNSADFRMDIRE